MDESGSTRSETRSKGLTASTQAGVTENGEIDLFAIAVLLRSKARRTFYFSVAGFLVMVIFVLTVKPRYAATAVLLVPQHNTAASSLALQLAAGGLDLAGGGFEIYQDILESRTVADRLIEQYHLKEVYGTNSQLNAEKILASRTLVATSKEGLIKVTVQDVDSKRAKEIANGYIAELDKMNQQLAITSAGQQRQYFEREMVKEKDALADSEVELQRTQESTGILVPESQMQENVKAIELTRAQLRLRQVQLGGLLQGSTEQNPEVIRLKAEISGFESQLRAMERGSRSDAGAFGMPTDKAPEKTLEYVRRAREVKFHEALFELLARQYETAKQQESKDVSLIELLDSAVVPERKTWPPRTLYSLLGIVAGALLGVVYTLMEAFVRTVMQNPENRAKYLELTSREAAGQS